MEVLTVFVSSHFLVTSTNSRHIVTERGLMDEIVRRKRRNEGRVEHLGKERQRE